MPSTALSAAMVRYHGERLAQPQENGGKYAPDRSTATVRFSPHYRFFGALLNQDVHTWDAAFEA
jgi:hypothetical protein